ncbi:MAG TPA: hypothetical protein VFA03_05770 [Acetobacteraceae bacterium]|nr:hypothetical protein [Acetobacteraceae bacterium]
MPDVSHLIERAAAQLGQSGPLGRIAPAPPEGPARHGVPPSPLGAPASDVPAIPMALLGKAGLVSGGTELKMSVEELWLAQRPVLRTAFGTLGPYEGAPLNLIMVTSARPGEGKSFAALNLAGSIARQGDHPVLLVDADMKHRSLSMTFGLGEASGLFDLAEADDLDHARMIVPTELPGLSFLPSGRSRTRSTDLLSRRHTGALVQGFAREHPERLVLIDTAPCLALGDASALAALVGQIIVVVEAERTQRAELEKALELLHECPNIWLLLNKSRHTASSIRYGYYDPNYKH